MYSPTTPADLVETPIPNSPNSITYPSPIPNYVNDARYQSGSTTPESEVEASLAYKGTKKYPGRKNRKLRKKKSKLPSASKLNNEEDVKTDVKDGGNTEVTIGVFEHTNYLHKSTQTAGKYVVESPARKDANKVTTTIPEKGNNSGRKTRSPSTDGSQVEKRRQVSTCVQTDSPWYTLGVFDGIAAMRKDEMRLLLERLKVDLCATTYKEEIIQQQDATLSTSSSSEQSILDEMKKEQEEVQEEVQEEFQEEVTLQYSSIAFDPQLSRIYSHRISESHEESHLSMSSMSHKISKEVTPIPVGHRASLTAPASAARVSSAHCMGRRSTIRAEPTIFELLRDQKGTSAKENPDILKYVGEKPTIVVEPDEFKVAEGANAACWYHGLCQFCGKHLLGIPTLEQSQDPSSDFGYCCGEFKYFITLHLLNEDLDQVEDVVIDIRPNAPFGLKSNRKTARERLADRQRERELERQKAAAQQANMFAFARQMKTIQYSLASQKCMSEGWTMKPPTPPPVEPPEAEKHYAVEVNSSLLQDTGALVQRVYDNGKPFLTMLPDGTGCCYYPSGNVAVFITSTEKGKYTYIVQTNQCYDDAEDCGLLAVFESNGNSICYYKKHQKIRSFINAYGGIELDPKGRKRKRWQWYFIRGHVHAPPFHPLAFSLNKYLSVRVIDQHNITLTFASNKRSIRFNVGAQLKAFSSRGHLGHFESDDSEKYLAEKRKHIATTLQKIHGALRLPKSTQEGKFPTFNQRKKEQLKKMMPFRQLPPLDDKQSVTIN